MSYLALYRAFRPKTFDEIIGQEHIVRTLINQIKTDKIGHAYLFCGARGTGKTTAAKVFARAINCMSPVNGSPCGKCEACTKLDNPANLDILEMDAASNNKVENVRDIRDKIQYPPVAGKYKVYIIDEVHMLTTEAFNALLKTLEEPPAHAVFILATTEVHKIPATILSRCLRFDFKLIPTNTIADLICKIYDSIQKKYTKEAVNLIAKAGEGSVRDALSIADICVSYTDGELTYDDVLEVLGTSDRAKIEELIKAIINGDTGAVLTCVDDLCMHGKSVSVLNKDVSAALRDLLVVKTCKNPESILGMPQDKMLELKKIAEQCDVHSLLRYVEIFSVAEADLKYSTHPRIVFETAAVKAGMPSADYNIDSLIARISKLEQELVNKTFAPQENAPIAQNKQPSQNAASSTTASFANSNSAASENNLAQEKNNGFVDLSTQTAASQSAYNAAKNFFADEKQIKKDKTDADNGFLSFLEQTTQQQTIQTPNITDKPLFENAPKAANNNTNAKADKNTNFVVGQVSITGVTVNQGEVEKTWGAILRKMRQDKEIMLWAACDDVSVWVSNGTFAICAPGENEYSFLSNSANTEKLRKYLSAEGFSDFKIVCNKEEALLKTTEDEETEKVKELFEDEKLIIKD